jgi:hypothetical protein
MTKMTDIAKTTTPAFGRAALALASVGLAVGIGFAGAAPAMAAPKPKPAPVVEAPAPAPAPTATQAFTVAFNLLTPNSPVVFTVNGVEVGTGTTNSVGDVTFRFDPASAGLQPGAYRLVATATASGISTSIGFSLR